MWQHFGWRLNPFLCRILALLTTFSVLTSWVGHLQQHPPCKVCSSNIGDFPRTTFGEPGLTHGGHRKAGWLKRAESTGLSHTYFSVRYGRLLALTSSKTQDLTSSSMVSSSLWYSRMTSSNSDASMASSSTNALVMFTNIYQCMQHFQ